MFSLFRGYNASRPLRKCNRRLGRKGFFLFCATVLWRLVRFGNAEQDVFGKALFLENFFDHASFLIIGE